MSPEELMSDREFLGALREIVVNTARITYYLASSTYAWHEIVSFLNSTKAYICIGVGWLVGYLFGRGNRK